MSLADHCGVTSRTLLRWAKAFNWKERIVQRDLEINRKTEEKTNKAIVNTKADYRAEIAKDLKSLKLFRQRSEKLIADATEAIEKKQIKITSVEELDRVVSSLKKYHDIQKDYVNLDLKLIGEDPQGMADLNIKLELPKDWNIDDII